MKKDFFKYFFIFLFLYFIGSMKYVAAQRKYTLSGVVQSAKSGETIVGATVYLDSSNIKTQSNSYGFFSLSVNAGTHTLYVEVPGMNIFEKKMDISDNLRLTISLTESTQLEDVVVSSSGNKGRDLKTPQMGMDRLSVKQIKNIPVLLGERDVLKALQLMPGVQSSGDGGSGFYVRGGSADQNLILLDEAPVYNASHLLGFFSTFNSDAIKDVTLYKSAMPAQYGGRLSSVVDVKMNEGNNQDYHVSGGVGLISAKLNVEGPIQKGKSSFLVSARRTYADMFLKLSNDSSVKNNSLYFYDLNAKLNFELGKTDRLYVSGYFGKDRLAADKKFGLSWGNATGTIRWNHQAGNKLFVNTSAIFSNYNYDLQIMSSIADFTLKSNLKDLHLKQEWEWHPNNNNTVKFGFSSIYHSVQPAQLDAKSGANDTSFQKRYGWENALFLNNEAKLSEKWRLSYGLRLTGFSSITKGNLYDMDAWGNITDTVYYPNAKITKTYINLEPRVAMSYLLNEETSLKASYARNTQNLHLVSTSAPGVPLDRWLLTNNIVKPEISDQVSIGYYRNFANNNYELSMETYYKTMQHQIDFKDGADVLSKDVMETELLYGKGRAYGMEWFVRKKTGRLTGWLSYTLAKSERKIDGINNSEWYSARQDRRHNISIVAIYNYNEKWTFSANWVYYSGDAISFPSGKYFVGGRTVYYYTERNGYRMPAYHRLDLAATMQLKKTAKYSSELAFGLYNAYGRKNPFIITFRDGKNNPNITEAVQTTLFTFVPSISYNFKF